MIASSEPRHRTEAEFEAALGAALAVEPDPTVAEALHERVARLITVGSRPRVERPGLRAMISSRSRSLSGRQRAGLLLAGILILGGAGRGLLGMYEGMVGPAGGWRTAWDRAEVIGASQTVDGYQVTIERAYADPSQLMLAISVRDTENRGWSQVAALGAHVVDKTGRTWEQAVGTSSPDGSSLAANLAWFSAPAGIGPGVQTFHVTVSSVSVRDVSSPPADANDLSWNPWHAVPGTWAFDIELNVRPGAVADLDASATASGVTVRLLHVAVAESQIRATLAVDAENAGQWSPIGSFEHGGASFAIGMGRFGDATIEARTYDGTGDASGSWVLRIDELVGDDENGQVRLQGPWVIEFTIP